MTTYFKFLKPGGIGPYSGFAWPVPNGKPGAWVKATGDLEVCHNGVHATTIEHLLDWARDELYVIELGGKIVASANKVVARKGRLLHRVEAWSPEFLSRFAAECVWRACRYAIRALRKAGYDKEADRLQAAVKAKDLDAARDAACAARAAWDAWAAARDAAGAKERTWQQNYLIKHLRVKV